MGHNVVNQLAEWPTGGSGIRVHVKGTAAPVIEVHTPTTGTTALTTAQVDDCKADAATGGTAWDNWVSAELGYVPATESANLRTSVLAMDDFPSGTGTMRLRLHYGVGGYDDVAAVDAVDWSAMAADASTGGATWSTWLDNNVSLPNRSSAADAELAVCVVAAKDF